MTDPFSDPASASGTKVTEFEGRLLLVTPKAYKEDIDTTFGKKDAVEADVVVIDESSPASSVKHAGMLLFQGRLIGQTKPKIGEGIVLGRLGKVPTDKGNPAWSLAAASDAEKDVARKYLASQAPQL